MKQFTIRIPEDLEKMDRVIKYEREKVDGAPEKVIEVLEAQRQRLFKAKEDFGERLSPENLEKA